jgi:hypothetical protein
LGRRIQEGCGADTRTDYATETPMMRSVRQYFPVLCLMYAVALPAGAQQRQWTPDDFDDRRPFGDIFVGTANPSQTDFNVFFDNLSAQKRSEIRSRCEVIGSDRRFAEWVRNICRQVEQTQDSTATQSRQHFAELAVRPRRDFAWSA